MFPFFAYPWALWGLVAVPALLGIYFLRNRFRLQPVSSLLLWQAHQEARAGGTRWEKIRLPLLFFLELAILILVILAASAPRVRLASSSGPLVVILDDSYSMLAGKKQSARDRALAALQNTLSADLRVGSATEARFVLARATPEVLGEATNSPTLAMATLRDWRCQAIHADLESAIALGAELAGLSGRLLVITDQPKPERPLGTRCQWWAFGVAVANHAMTQAARTVHADGENLFVEVAQYGEPTGTVNLRVETLGAEKELFTRSLPLAPNSSERVTLRLPKGLSTVRAILSDDELSADNQAVLLPVVPEQVRTRLAVANARLRDRVEQALNASGRVVWTEVRPDLWISDDPQWQAPSLETWGAILLVDAETSAYVGPFVVDRAHPLTKGLDFAGVIWSAGQTSIPGTPVVLAGKVPLLTTETRLPGQQCARLRVRLDESNLHESPNWPIFWWNLLDWRAQHLPGARPINGRVGSNVAITLPDEATHATITRPLGEESILPTRAGILSFRADQAGIHSVRAGKTTFEFAVNPLAGAESDLTGSSTGKWVEGDQVAAIQWGYRDISRILLALALFCLLAHALVISTTGTTGKRSSPGRANAGPAA